MSEVIGSVWWMLVTLGLLVTFHEYGHFVIARACGVKVLRFSIGFGKPLWTRVDRHGTEFVVAAIPLGGYVKMLDEREVDGPIGPAGLAGAFNRQPVGKRMAITAAGPIANFLFAIVAFWLMLVIGKPDYQAVVGRSEGLAAVAGVQPGERIVRAGGADIENWTDLAVALMKGSMERRAFALDTVDAAGAPHQRSLALDKLPADADEGAMMRAVGLIPRHAILPAVIGEVTAEGAAQKAGVQRGDRIVAIDGDAVRDWSDVPRLIQAHGAAGHAMAIQIERAGAALTLSILPVQDKADEGKPVWRLGIGVAPGIAPDALLRHGPLESIPKAFAATWSGIGDSFDLIGKMLSGAASPKNLSGVIGIAQAANATANMGAAWFLNFLALISISLGVLNLLPIPVLDGGHLLYYVVELIRGRPVSERVQIAAQYVGLFLIVALMSLALYNDVFHLASRG